MEKWLRSLALVLLGVLCALPAQSLAQDTLNVAALPAGNINTVINSDTLAGGVRAHPDRVYRLTRGSVYQVTEPLKINGPLQIVATVGTNRPPVLAPAILADNKSIDHFFEFIGKGAKVSLSNIYLLSIRADNAGLGWSAGIRIWADSITLKLRGVIFDAFSEAGIRVYAHWTKLDVQDCHFRNHQHSSSWFGGQPYMTEAPNHLDTCKFINNTFFACNSYLWSIRGYDKYSVFEHNTLVYGTVNPFLMRQGMHMRIRNNIFYAMHAMGGNPDHVWGAWFLNWPDTTSSSIVRIRTNTTYQGRTTTGPEAYIDLAHGVDSSMVLPAKRYFVVENNAYFWPTKLTSFYQAYNDTVVTADSIDLPSGGKALVVRKIIPATWINPYTQLQIDSVLPSLGAQVNVQNNFNADPGFNATVASHVDKLIDYVHKICIGKLDTTWFFHPTAPLYPPLWPLPEDLAYTNVGLQSSGKDGFAVGDLNWFPLQKAAWLLTDVQPVEPLPEGFSLLQNYPNPFNPLTNIPFTLKSAEHVTLVIYNMLGQRVRTLADQEMTAGSYVVPWDGTNDRGVPLASGAYYYRLKTKSLTSTRSMMLVK